jgi:hypothetical protein
LNEPYDYFAGPVATAHKKYEALRAFFYEKLSAEEVSFRPQTTPI